MTEARDVLVRYLRQRAELGETELILQAKATDLLPRSAGLEPASAGDSSKIELVTNIRVPPEDLDFGRERGGSKGATASAGQELVQIGSLAEIARIANVCTACGLASTRTTVVFSDGDPTARLVVVGEAPGGDEDRVGRPFVGRAGKLLDTLLTSVNLPREAVYICNVLKCRPPSNRNPLPEEVEACFPFLRRQIEIVGPAAILAVGTFPAQTLLKTTAPISRLRGRVHEYGGVPLIPTYHPAALLRNSAWIRPVWEDLQRLRAILEA